MDFSKTSPQLALWQPPATALSTRPRGSGSCRRPRSLPYPYHNRGPLTGNHA
jgi:hypothetical protein